MNRALVVYATTHGQTRRIALRIADRLRAHAFQVDVRDVREAPEDPYAYDLVVAGGSLHGGRHQHELLEWLSHHATSLSRVPSALFSVSLSAAEGTDQGRGDAQGALDLLCEETGWFPRTRACIAGALQYREYDHVTKMVMRLLMARHDHPTDITQDVEYTDWDQVDAFADEAAAVPAAAGSH